MLKFSDFYLYKQKSFIPKNIIMCTMYHGLGSSYVNQKMPTWCPNFVIHGLGFGQH